MTYCGVYTGILLWSIIGALNGVLNFLPSVIEDNHSDILSFSSDMVITDNKYLITNQLQITLAMPYILIVNDSNIQRDIKEIFQTPVEVAPVLVSVSSEPRVTDN